MRAIGIFLMVALAGYVFVLWLLWPDFLSFIGCGRNSSVLTIGFFVAFGMDLSYMVYCLGYLKRNIINYL